MYLPDTPLRFCSIHAIQARESHATGVKKCNGRCRERGRLAASYHLREQSSLPEVAVCRNIKTLFNFEPPATDEEIRASALQFVRKLSGFNKPSKANEEAFNLAIEQVTEAARTLVHSLVTVSPPRDREEVRAKAMAEAAKRFAKS
jgi:hypothetical protein